jgi:hypothetical protein
MWICIERPPCDHAFAASDVFFCGARGHTSAAAFDRALRAARLSQAEALRAD